MSAPAAPSGEQDAPVDLVVLGAGSGGYAAALRAAQLGLSVVLVEADKVGGTCLHRGCIPTKAQLHAAQVADQVRHGASVGVRASLEGIDLGAVRDFGAKVIDRLYRGLAGLIDQRGITVVSGFGTLVRTPGDGLAVSVEGRLIHGRSVVLATGSRPNTLGLPVDGERVLTSDHALALEQLPSSAIVLGGGVIGVEFASLWRSFGVEVTIVEALDRLVPGEDPAISKALQRAFTKRGITVRTGARVDSVAADGSAATVRLQDGSELSADVVLVAPGRLPVSADLGYEQAGVRLRDGFVETDPELATTAPGVYAVGDLVRGPQLAHRGFGHGIFVAERIAHLAGRFDRRPVLAPDQLIPRVTYCSPEIASVGLTRDKAEALGPIEVVEYNLAGNGRSQILGTAGFVQLVRRKDGPIVGVHMIGEGVSELIGQSQLTVAWDATPSDFAGLVQAHPTQGEAFGEAIMALAGAPLHVH